MTSREFKAPRHRRPGGTKDFCVNVADKARRKLVWLERAANIIIVGLERATGEDHFLS